MAGADVSATVAVAESDGFATLVAVMAMAFGEGATAGAVKFPLPSTEPQSAPEQPWPGTAEETLQVTAALERAEALARNRNCCDGARNA